MKFVELPEGLRGQRMPARIAQAPVSVSEFAGFLNATEPLNHKGDGDYAYYNLNNPELPIRYTEGRYWYEADRVDVPVTGVTLQGVMAFGAWAGCRLLSLREWKTLIEFEGLVKASDKATYWYARANVEDRVGRLLPRGSILTDKLQLADLIGNAASWCLPDELAAGEPYDVWLQSAPVVGCAYNKAYADSDEYWTYFRWARTGAVGVGFRCAQD